MVELPAATPVTTPVEGFTVAAAVLLLLHVPPPVPFVLKVVDEPAHTDGALLIVPAFTTAFTVINCVAVEVPQLLDTV
jgi:hypothetical protein